MDHFLLLQLSDSGLCKTYRELKVIFDKFFIASPKNSLNSLWGCGWFKDGFIVGEN